MDIDDYESLPTTNSAVHMAAGAVAGVMEHCIMYPLDSAKTRMQSLQPSPEARYRSVGEAISKMVRKEGMFRPMRGMSAVVSGAGPAHALYFSCYEKIKASLIPLLGTGYHNTLIPGFAGCCATLLHDAIMTPADVIKQRMQVYKSPYRSCLDCVVKIYRGEGFSAFYRSYSTQLAMNIPFQSIHFTAYELMQSLTNPQRHYSPVAHMVSGATAGAVAAAVTTPLDVCKTLLNTQESSALSKVHQDHISGISTAVRTVYRINGVWGFFQGLQARMLYVMPSTAICWSVYELFKYLLDDRKVPPELVVSSVETDSEHEDSPSDSVGSVLPSRLDVSKPVSSFAVYPSLGFTTAHTVDTSRFP